MAKRQKNKGRKGGKDEKTNQGKDGAKTSTIRKRKRSHNDEKDMGKAAKEEN